jgi:hypothetical protein
MTAATASIACPSARTRLVRHWERSLIVLGICLPIPLLAATGLSVPLPATVERIAAALVPWMDASAVTENDALLTGTSGEIIRSPSERSEPASPTPAAVSNPRSAVDEAVASQSGNGKSDGGRHNPGGAGGSEGSSGEGSGSGGSGGSSGSGGGSGGGSPGAGGGTTNPVGGAVDDVQGTVGTVVDDATGTVDDATGTVDDVVDSTAVEETVDGLVSGLGK